MNNTLMMHRLNYAFLKHSMNFDSLAEVQNAVIDAGLNLQAGAHPNHVFGRLRDQLTTAAQRSCIQSERAAVELFTAALITLTS